MQKDYLDSIEAVFRCALVVGWVVCRAAVGGDLGVRCLPIPLSVLGAGGAAQLQLN